MVLMHSHKGSKVANVQLWLAAVAILTPLIALPSWGAAPVGYKTLDVGNVGAAGSVDLNATTGVWTVKGAGDLQDTTNADGIFFIYQEITGDGAIIARVVSQNTAQGQPKTGIMIRTLLNEPGSPYAGLMMTTSTTAWQYRATKDANAVRVSGADARAFPELIMLRRVGDQVQGYVTGDGKYWIPNANANTTLTLPFDPAGPAFFGVAVSSRSVGTLTTAEFDNVAVLQPSAFVKVTESALSNNAALLVWAPIADATGYVVYRGPKTARSLSEMTMLGTVASTADTAYLDIKASPDPLKSLAYAISVVKTVNNQAVEGPVIAVR